MQNSNEETMRQFSQIMQRVHKLRPAPFVLFDELTHAESVALHMVYVEHKCSPGAPVRPRAIAERLRISRSALSQLLKTLTSKGVIERQRDCSDSRAVEITLTPAGVSAACKIDAAVSEEVDQLIAFVGLDNFKAMTEAMELVCQYLEMKSDANVVALALDGGEA